MTHTTVRCFSLSFRLAPFRVAGAALMLATCLANLVSLVQAQDRTGPFRHDTRSVRSRDFDQQHVRLELAFDMEKQTVDGQARLRLAPYAAQSSLRLDAVDMEIIRVLQNSRGGQPAIRELKKEQQGGQLRIDFDAPLNAGEAVELTIEYRIREPRHGFHFVVPDEQEPDQPRMVWTQSEPEYARYWFPCIDTPADRLTSEILATVPADFFVLSNGVLRGKTRQRDGRQTWHWRQMQPHVPYLLSVVAGRFEAFEQKWNDVPVVSYVPVGRLADAARSFEKTPRMVDYFSHQIGVKYPWPKYTQICVDEYMWGGMEHTTATTLNLGTLHDERAHLDVSSDNLVAHELAHQWFGDLLTCKDWGELWLNESFATYFATLWTEEDLGWDEAAWERLDEAHDYLNEDKRYRRAIVNYRYNSPENMFDSHSYPKGGRVLHMLRFVLGDEAFWKVIRHYVQSNQQRSVETANLRIAIEDVTGQGLNWFFDQWILRGGHPEFRVSWNWDETAKLVRVAVKQVQKVDELTPVFRTPVEIEVVVEGKSAVHRVEIDQADESFHFAAAARPSRVCFDPRDWLLKTLQFPKSKEELMDQLANSQHLVCRLQAAEGLAEFVGHEDASHALRWAARKDAFWAVRRAAVNVLAKAQGDAARTVLIEAAHGDERSPVRRAALTALANFSHDDTRAALRHAIGADRSYFAVADALRSLAKLDRAGAAEDLKQALAAPSHDNVILNAAIDGLAELKEEAAAHRLLELLEPKDISPERRAALIAGIARLRPTDETARQRLLAQLQNDRSRVRQTAIAALVTIGDPAAIDSLQQRRAVEESPRMIQRLDDAIEKLRAKQTELLNLQKQLDQLRQQNQDLEGRLKKLEKPS